MTALFAENLINDCIQYSLFLHVINGADKIFTLSPTFLL